MAGLFEQNCRILLVTALQMLFDCLSKLTVPVAATDSLYLHSRRTHAFGAINGRVDGYRRETKYHHDYGR